MPRVLRSSTKKKRQTPARKTKLKDVSPPKLEITDSARRTPRRRPLPSAEVRGQKVTDMSINTIRKALATYAADTTGTKAVLQERLIDILKSGAKPKPATPSAHKATPKRSKTPRGTPRSARKRRNLEEITNVDVKVLSRIAKVGKDSFTWDGKEVSKLTVIDLKEILHALGIIKTGLKQELQERVVEAFKLCKSASTGENETKEVKSVANAAKPTAQAKENTVASEDSNRRPHRPREETVKSRKVGGAQAAPTKQSESMDTKLSAFTVEQLKQLLRNRDRKTTGRKLDLIQRLRRYMISSKETFSSVKEEVDELEESSGSASESSEGAVLANESNEASSVAEKKHLVPTKAKEELSRSSPSPIPTGSHSSTLLAGSAKSPLPSKSPRMPTRRKTPSHLLQSLKENSPQPVGTLLSSKGSKHKPPQETVERTSTTAKTASKLSPQTANVTALPVADEVAKLPERVPPKAEDIDELEHVAPEVIKTTQPEHIPPTVAETTQPEPFSPMAIETTRLEHVPPKIAESAQQEHVSLKVIETTQPERMPEKVNETVKEVEVEESITSEKPEDGEDDEGYFTPEEAPETVEVEEENLESVNEVEVVVSEPVVEEVEGIKSEEDLSSNKGSSSNEMLENLVLQIASKGITSSDFEEYDSILKGLVVEDDDPVSVEDDDPVLTEAPSASKVRLERPTPVRLNREGDVSQQAPASGFALPQKRSGPSTTPAGPPKWRQSLLSTLGDSTGDVSPFYDMGPSYSSRKNNPGSPQHFRDRERTFSDKNTYNRNSLVRPRPAVSFLNAQERLPHSLKKPRLDTPYFRKPITPQPRNRDSILDSRAF